MERIVAHSYVVIASVPIVIFVALLKAGPWFWLKQFLIIVYISLFQSCVWIKKVQVGNDQEKAQSERNSHSKNRDGKNKIDN